MAENQTTTEESGKEEKRTLETYTFPSSLRADVDNGHPCVQFKVMQPANTTQDVNIFLYQPSGVSVIDGASYTNLDMGLLGAASGLADSGGKTKFTQSDAVAAGLLGKDAVASFTGLDIAKGGAVGALKSGVAANPYTRVAFEGTSLRTFEFNFKLVAESAEETEIAKKIERTFRKFLYPERAGAIALAYPPLFQITYFTNGEESLYMPRIKPSYLTSLTTTFNESTNAVFQGTGAPIEITLALSFQEERQLVRQDLYTNNSDIDERKGGYFDGGT